MTTEKPTPRCNAHPTADPKYVPVSAGTGELHCSICNRLLWETNAGDIKQPDQPKKAKVSAKLPPCPAQDYTQPSFHKVATKIVADDPMYVPGYQTPGSACVDLVANITEEGGVLRLPHRGCYVVDCGFSMELPAGYKAEISARSSWASKGLLVANAPGQVDTDYRGRVRVAVLNAGKEIIVINHGDRIAQMSIAPVYLFDWILAPDLGDTQRGAGGFGSTGRQ